MLLYCAIGPPAAVLTYIAFLPMWEGRPLLALGSAALSLALLTAGILLLDEPGQRGSASMLIASSALLVVGWLNIWRVGPLPLISVASYGVDFAIAFAAASLGYRLVRARQMAVQYGWLYRRRGPLGWRAERPVS